MLRGGLVGGGFMGRMHANAYALIPNVTIEAVVDGRPEAGRPLAEHCKARYYGDLAAMLAAEKLDFVDICLPTYLHAEVSVQAMDAGLHVLCEKPMALSLEEADRMIAAADRNGVQLMIAHCIRFWPEYSILKQYVDDGRLGQLRSLTLFRVGPRPGWSAGSWFADEKRSGGAALDLHIHDTDFALYLLGKPDEIHSRGVVDELGASIIHTTMMFGPVAVYLEGAWYPAAHVPFKMGFRASFDRGVVAMDNGPLTVYDADKEPWQPAIDTPSAVAAGGNISDLGGYYHEIAYFTGCLESGVPVTQSSGRSARESLATVFQEVAAVRSDG